MLRRILAVALLCAVGSPAAAGRPVGNAAMVARLKTGISKPARKLLRSIGTAPHEMDESGVRTISTKQGSYSEQHTHDAGNSVADSFVSNGRASLSTRLYSSARGKFERLITVEVAPEKQKIEVITKKGIFQISQRVTVTGTRYGSVVSAAPRALKLGRLRIPIGTPNQKIADDVLHMHLANHEINAFTIDEKLAAPPMRAETDTHDIALGLDHTKGRMSLDTFGEAVGGTVYTAWGTRDVTHEGSADPAEFRGRFHDAVQRTIKNGGRIKFDLTGLERGRRIQKQGGAAAYGSITTWELQQLRDNPAYLASTDFYKQTKAGSFKKMSEREVRHALQ